MQPETIWKTLFRKKMWIFIISLLKQMICHLLTWTIITELTELIVIKCFNTSVWLNGDTMFFNGSDCHLVGQYLVCFGSTAETKLSFWAKSCEVFKVSVVLCHQTKTELRQRAQDGRKRKVEGWWLIKHSTESGSCCGREKLCRKERRLAN